MEEKTACLLWQTCLPGLIRSASKLRHNRSTAFTSLENAAVHHGNADQGRPCGMGPASWMFLLGASSSLKCTCRPPVLQSWFDFSLQLTVDFPRSSDCENDSESLIAIGWMLLCRNWCRGKSLIFGQNKTAVATTVVTFHSRHHGEK